MRRIQLNEFIRITYFIFRRVNGVDFVFIFIPHLVLSRMSL